MPSALLVGMAFGAAALEVHRGERGTAALQPSRINVTARATVQQSEAFGAGPATKTFLGFYDAHAEGRGIWKWSNALVAYQRHFGPLAGHPVDVAEVGVQSGGSLLMWRGVFGDSCHVYGLDINPKCLMFQDARTTITIGDQAKPEMWGNFFTKTVKGLDILVDDGGHEPLQMLTTVAEVFPRLNPGGFITIEDIHGQNYIQTFFKPVAAYLAQQSLVNQVASVHVYPFVLMVHKAGVSPKLPKTEISFAGSSVKVDSLEALWQEVPKHAGGHIILLNPGWGPFLTEAGMYNFFAHFAGLHDGNWYDTPKGCQTTAAAVCTNTVVNSPQQNVISGIHIYPTFLVVEVAPSPPVIKATRRGTKWLVYGL